ncbi:MAG: hypothetical protein RL310_811 [Actinomycetota bacterium]
MSADSVQSKVASAILNALELAKKSGLINCQTPGQIILDRPKNRDHGDYATSIALTLAKAANLQPRVIAEMIIKTLNENNLLESAGISKVEIAGPGFINITLEGASQASVVIEILSAGKKYGQGQSLAGKKINLEFVSANPTGPIHLGHTRWAAVGDSLGRVLSAAGAQVSREFYINDRGNQMDLFGQSLRAAALGIDRPENGYHGEYIADLANEITKANPEFTKLDEDAGIVAFREAGYKLQLDLQREVLENFGTHFDTWFSERSLYENNFFNHTLDKLKSNGHVYEEEGAVWLRTTDFGDDKDRVMIKSDGSFAYFASDSAYYISKRERGFNLCIYMLGADHHGYVNRLRAVAACAGDDPDKNVEVLIGQLVKMLKNGQEVRLSKRAGNIITLEDLVDEVGVDAARYTLTRYPVDTPLTLEIDLLTSHTNDNPVFYVQYAHARIAAVIRSAQEKGIDWQKNKFNPAALVTEQEAELLGALSEFPRIVSSAAQLRQPHRVARYLEELATAYHSFYSACRVLPLVGEPVTDETIARLVLCAATKQVVKNGLDLLGVSAPEKM